MIDELGGVETLTTTLGWTNAGNTPSALEARDLPGWTTDRASVVA